MTEARARRRRRAPRGDTASKRKVNYRHLRNPFPPMTIFSDDEIASMHEASLRTLEELGIKVLLSEARRLYRQGGARVEGEMVFIGREIVEAALTSAPRSITCRAGARDRDVLLELDLLNFQPGAGAPHATDLTRGRRPGTVQDYRELVRITQHYDVLQMMPALIGPQDVPIHLRHYFTMEAQLTLSDKLPFISSRGSPQVGESFEMLRDCRGLDDAEFRAEPHCYTLINTNSPRVLDVPMARGLIDFARANQVSIVAPFTLMGAMAPITAASAITLTQLARKGAPICYGTFTSNVDMKSGAPAFRTPAHFHASLAAGQLARMIGLPWRSAAGSAANLNDVQAANENQLGLWCYILAGATLVIHSAGWLEGGLTVSYKKLICDVEVLNMVAELCAGAQAGASEIGLGALAEVQPSGHFFSAAQTIARYQIEFYEPVVHDYANFGTWKERGSQDASPRATKVWQSILAEDTGPAVNPERIDALKACISRQSAAGGAPSES
ncbi:MAG: trimethylamine methyltransferase family protein [Pseudomonadota bacterium]